MPGTDKVDFGTEKSYSDVLSLRLNNGSFHLSIYLFIYLSRIPGSG